MSDKKEEKISPEELNKMEEEAYFELCQIIAEAMQYQDIELLDYRIAAWKKKYKKLLDSPLAGSRFKRRIEYLLNEYYSSITLYIWQQIKKQEQKKIEKQYKAMRKLYKIIDETNDLKTLKKEVEKWEEKYPPASFLQMYQKKIKRLTSEKNLKENAFDQDQAYYDLYRITKKTGTLDELKEEVRKWKQNYRIDSQFKIDDFIKNQSDVKRYTSEAYLDSIARHDEKQDEETLEESKSETIENEEKPLEENNNTYSDLGKQARAYSSLIIIAKTPNNLDKMFNWVHKNSSIKFNEEYKSLILSATYLDYSPKYLSSLNAPNIDILKTNLTLDEFKQLKDIKRYAIISYFNSLLPETQAVTNNYFRNYVKDIYYKSKNSKLVDEITVSEVTSEEGKEENVNLQFEKDIDSVETKTTDPHSQKIESVKLDTDLVTSVEKPLEENKEDSKNTEITSSEIVLDNLDNLEETSTYQISLNKSDNQTQTFSVTKEQDGKEHAIEKEEDEPIKKEPIIETKTTIDSQEKELESEVKPEPVPEPKVEVTQAHSDAHEKHELKVEINNNEFETGIISNITVESKKEEAKPEEKSKIENKVNTEVKEEPTVINEKINPSEVKKQDENKEENKTEKIRIKETVEIKKEKKEEPKKDNETIENEEIDVNTYSYMFFDQIYDYSVQAEIIETIDESVKDYEENELSLENEISDSDMLVQRNKIDN